MARVQYEALKFLNKRIFTWNFHGETFHRDALHFFFFPSVPREISRRVYILVFALSYSYGKNDIAKRYQNAKQNIIERH